MLLGELLILFICIVLSAFFSASEIAYVNANKIKIEIKARRNNFPAKIVKYFVNNPEKYFSTILIGNNIVNIAFASISTIILIKLFNLSEIEILIVSTLVLLFFGEIFPKYFARELSEVFVIAVAVPIRFISILLSPLVKLTSVIARKITGFKKLSDEQVTNIFTVEDMEYLVDESLEAGIVNKSESNIIKKVFDLREQRVYEAMRPRTEIVGVEINSSTDDLLDAFIESGFSKLPVYEENLDNIKGVILAYDLFKSPAELKSILREVIFVPETKKSIDMLDDFLDKRVSIAIVVDEFGGTAGLVTMEDIIEELFGEIKDEYDIEETLCKKIGENSFAINGKVEIDSINEQFNLGIPEGDYETIAGFITQRIGRIPLQGEKINIDNFHFQIIRANNIRIELVKLYVDKI